MDLIDVPQTTKLLLTLLQSVMPVLLISVPALTYMNFINGQFAKLSKPVIVEVAQSPAPKRAAPCHYNSGLDIPPPPPLAQ